VLFTDDNATAANAKLYGYDVSAITAGATRTHTIFDYNGALGVVGVQTAAATAGNLGKRDLTAQGAAIAATNLTATAAVGHYLVAYYLEDTTLDLTAGTIQFQINYTDTVGATTQVSAALVLTAVGRTSGVMEAYLASGELSYQTNLTGIIGAAKYALRVRVTYLG